MNIIAKIFGKKNNEVKKDVKAVSEPVAVKPVLPRVTVDADRILDLLFGEFGLVEEELDNRGIADDYTLYWDGEERNGAGCSLEYPDGHEVEYSLVDIFKENEDKDFEGQFTALKDYIEDVLIPKMMQDIDDYNQSNGYDYETPSYTVTVEEPVFVPQSAETSDDEDEEDSDSHYEDKEEDEDDEEEVIPPPEDFGTPYVEEPKSKKDYILISRRNRNGKVSYYAQVNGKQVERAKLEKLEEFIRENGSEPLNNFDII